MSKLEPLERRRAACALKAMNVGRRVASVLLRCASDARGNTVSRTLSEEQQEIDELFIGSRRYQGR